MTVADLITQLRGVAHDAEVVLAGEFLRDAASLAQVTIVPDCDRPEEPPRVVLSFE